MNNKEPENNTYFMPLGMSCGLAIGTAIGTATNHLSIFMPLGVSMGLFIGALLDKKHREKSETDEDKE